MRNLQNRLVDILDGIAEVLLIEGSGNLLAALGRFVAPLRIVHHMVDGIQEFLGTGVLVAVFSILQNVIRHRSGKPLAAASI